jgi:hypothetical protein
MANEFKPTIGSRVPKEEAKKWIDRYDIDHRVDKKKDTKSVFFGKERLMEVLETPHAAGISFFFAKKYNEQLGKEINTLVLVPTKEDGTLIWPERIDGKDGGSPYSWDDGLTCPPTCPKLDQ